MNEAAEILDKVTFTAPVGAVLSVRWLQAREHRKVLHIPSRERRCQVLGGGCDREIGDTDPRMACAPASPKRSRAAGDLLGDRDPLDQLEECLGVTALRRAESLDDLDAAHLRAGWLLIERRNVIAGRGERP